MSRAHAGALTQLTLPAATRESYSSFLVPWAPPQPQPARPCPAPCHPAYQALDDCPQRVLPGSQLGLVV